MKLFYRQFGNGKPLVILHGLFGMSDNWVSIGKLLAQNYNVIIPDLRNHGQSPQSDIFNYAAMTNDLLELLNDLDLHSAIIMGHSMGGKVAMQFALQYPEKTDKLIVADMSMRHYDERHMHIEIIKAMMAVDFENTDTRSAVSELLKSSIPDEKVRLFIMKNLYRKTRTQLGWRPNLIGVFQNIDSIFESIFSNNNYTGASLFIHGAESDYVRKSDIPVILHHFPAAIFNLVSHAGHWVHADNPEEFMAHLTAFLGMKLE